MPNPFDDDDEELSELPEPGGEEFERDLEAARQRSKGRTDRTPERELNRPRTAGGKTPGSEEIDARLRALIGAALGFAPQSLATKSSSTKPVAKTARGILPKVAAAAAPIAAPTPTVSTTTATSEEVKLPNCARCGAAGARGNCARCKTAYCDATCLEEDWETGIHEAVCSKVN
jgi:hypothetical protein